MSEAEFLAGLGETPGAGRVRSMCGPLAEADADLGDAEAWAELMGWGVVVQPEPGPVLLPWLPADAHARVLYHFGHAGTVRLTVRMPEARHAGLPPEVRERLRPASPGVYIVDVPEGDVALRQSSGASGPHPCGGGP